MDNRPFDRQEEIRRLRRRIVTGRNRARLATRQFMLAVERNNRLASSGRMDITPPRVESFYEEDDTIEFQPPVQLTMTPPPSTQQATASATQRNTVRNPGNARRQLSFDETGDKRGRGSESSEDGTDPKSQKFQANLREMTMSLSNL